MVEKEEKQTRSEYRVASDDTLASLLERIRETPGTELLLDITENSLLLKDGSLRRALVSAAGEFKKRVAFSFSEKQNPRKNERPEEKKRNDGAAKPVPVAVFRDLPKIKLGRSGKSIAVFFSFFAGLLLAGGIFFILPRANVKLTPDAEPISLELPFTATVSALNVDVEKAVVPAQVLNYEENVDLAFPVKGFAQLGQRSRGQVTIINKTVTEQKIKGKSRLKNADGLVFTMDESAIIAPHSSASVRVTADGGGVAGNLQNGKLYFVALPETDQNILFAEIITPFSGGTDETVSALNEDDVEKAKQQFLAENQEKLKKTLADSLVSDVVRDDRFFDFDLSGLASAEPAGAQISEFHLKGKVKARYFVFKRGDVDELIKRVVEKRVGSGKVLSKPLDEASLHIGKIDWKENALSLNYSLQNSLQNDFDLTEIKKNLVARTADGAKTYLLGLSGVKDASIKLSPFWVKRVPGFKKNIRIEMEVR